jgi:hypothetical protein
MGHALFIAESFGGCNGEGVAGGQQAGEERAESEQRCGGAETPNGKGALHRVGENRAKKAVDCEAEDHARSRADQRAARGDPQDMRGAPSARRTPNSVVRCATLYATRLKMPISASPSAMAEKTPNKMEKSR